MQPDTMFLSRAIDILRVLHERSLERGHPMLASLIEMARIEAEDDLSTAQRVDDIWAPFYERDAEPPPSASSATK